MSGNLEIRDYMPDDEVALIALIRELQAHESAYYDRMVPPDQIAGWYVDNLLEDCAAHLGHIRLIECDGNITGYHVILTKVLSTEADEQEFHYAYVSEIAVAANARGQGIGHLLLDDAQELAIAAGAKWLRVSVLAKNTVARDLYKAHGFNEHLMTLEKPLP